MRFENNNKEVIKKITNRSLKSNKTRNTFAILAIILTTFMISSVFSIGISFAKNYRTMNLRIQGTTATIALPNPTNSQINNLKSTDMFNSIGKEIRVGKVSLDSLKKNRTKIIIKYIDKENYEKQIIPCISDIKGSYPKKENEVMMSKKTLELLGQSSAKIGDNIKVRYKINSKVVDKEFTLSGYYTDYAIIEDTGYILVSEKFVKVNNLSLEKNGTVYMDVKSKERNNAQDILSKEIKLNKNQKISYAYDRTDDLSDTVLSTTLIVIIIALFIILSGYLLIYNVLYIAVNKDINFYGLLKTIGTSPKQIKKIVKGQALRLSLIGIPIGLILGLVVSFNPIIFILSALFSLFTVMMSCKKPAKIAGNISPTEALRYSGSTPKKSKKNRKTTKGGKLYKMAWYNIFREKKRAVVVFLSLFMGIITFLSVNTFLSSVSIDNYIDRYVKNDFEIQNMDIEENKIDDNFVNKIKNINGIENINIFKESSLQVDMNNEVILPALKTIYQRFGVSDKELNTYLENVKKDPSLLSASVVGIDDNLIERFNDELKEKIDVESFKKGELALVDSWYYDTDIYKNISGKVTIRNIKDNISSTFNIKMINDSTIGLLPSGQAAPVGVPTIFISSNSLEKIDKNSITSLLYINVDKKYEEKIKLELKKMSNTRGLWFESKSESTESFNKSQMVMNILGGGIAIILILIGILNFINIMITGINSRLKELAVLESIGMTKKQIKKMVTFEGLYYGLITIGFILTIGVGIIYGVAELTKNIADYAVFVFPTVPLIFLIIVILLICIITPSFVFKISTKQSVTERIREIDK